MLLYASQHLRLAVLSSEEIYQIIDKYGNYARPRDLEFVR